MNYRLNTYYTLKKGLDKRYHRNLFSNYVLILLFFSSLFYFLGSSLSNLIVLPFLVSELSLIVGTRLKVNKLKRRLLRVKQKIAQEENNEDIRKSYKALDNKDKEKVKEMLSKPKQVSLVNKIMENNLQDTLDEEDIYYSMKDFKEDSRYLKKVRKRTPQHLSREKRY